MRRWNAQAFGVAVPGFIDPSNSGRVIDRRHGAALREAFAAFEDARVSVVLLEGLTDWEESAGFYRSHEWRTAVGQQDAELYLRIVRECGDRLRTEAGVDPAIERILTRIQAIEQQLNQLRNDVLQLREDEARRGRLGLNPPDPPV